MRRNFKTALITEFSVNRKVTIIHSVDVSARYEITNSPLPNVYQCAYLSNPIDTTNQYENEEALRINRRPINNTDRQSDTVDTKQDKKHNVQTLLKRKPGNETR